MLQPCGVRPTALIAHALTKLRQSFIVGNDHAAFAGCNLFVGIEGKHSGSPEGTEGTCSNTRAESLAGVFEHMQSSLASRLHDRLHLTGPAEDVNRHDRPRARAESGTDAVGIQIQRRSIDVYKHRLGADVQDAVRGGHEAER